MKANLQSADPRGGFALVLTLLALVLLTVLVVGFNAATRTEQMAARNYSYQGVASQMAEVGVNRAMALLNSTVTNGVVTQPGRAWSPDTNFVPLTSAAIGTGRTNVNLNQRSLDQAGTNYFISTNTNSAFFTVPVIDVRVSNVLVGGYAFWVDDDGSRVNLNAAWTNARTNFLPTNSRPYSLAPYALPSVASANFASLITNQTTNSTQGWGYFFTPRQILMMGDANSNTVRDLYQTFQRLMFEAAGGPGNQARATFALAPTNGQGVAIDAGGLQGMLSVHGDRRYTNSLANLTNALDRAATNFFAGAKYRTYFGNTNGLLGKYGPDITRQIIANLNDFVLPTGAVAPANKTTVTGTTAANMLSPELIPSVVAGYRPFPFLNEIASQIYYFTNQVPGGTSLQIQVWVALEIANPFGQPWGEGSQVALDIASWRVRGSYKGTNGSPVPFVIDPAVAKTNWTVAWGTGTNNSAQTNMPARSYTNIFLVLTNGTNLPVSITNANDFALTNELDLARVRFLQWFGAPETIRDWAYGPDLDAWTRSTTAGNLPVAQTNFTQPNGQVPPSQLPAYVSNNWGSTNAIGVAKNDPRVRRFPSYNPPSPPWLPVGNGGLAVTIGSNNSTVDFAADTLWPGAPRSDKTTNASNDIMTHESFARDTLRNTFPARDLLSAFDLAQVHTGLQWRTLQFRAQDTTEAGSAPDWALLEIFTVTNSPITVPAKLNVNSQSFPAGSSPGMNANNLLSAGMARPLALASLLAGNTNTNSATNAQIGVTNAGIPASAVFPASGASSYLAVASNIARLDFSAAWAGNRPTNLPTNSIVMLSEVLEVNGVSNVGNDEGANEGRVRGFYDALAAASDVFTVYSAGYAMDKKTNVTGETFLRSQVARDPADPTKFRVIYTEPLIWK
jgi:hypothetical protein